jgi:phytoene dehydrogenase-like protein
MSNETYDVIVIGAGPGGAVSAALLAKQGVKTLLLDKNDRAGGKALTLSSKGFSYELWPVSGGPSHSSRWEELIKELELDVELLTPEGAILTLYRNPSGEYVPYQAPGPIPPTPEEAEGLGRFFNDMMSLSPQEIDALDEVTCHEFVSRYQVPQAFYSSLAMQSNIVFVVPIDLLAASEMVKTIRDMQSGVAGCYFKGGYGKISEGCAKAVERYGSEVRLRTRVERIAIEEGQVRGVVTDKGTFHAPIVISNAGIQPTVLKLVGEEQFDKGYVNYVKDLVPSLGIMGIRYFLSKPVLDHPMYLTFSDDNYFNVERATRA